MGFFAKADDHNFEWLSQYQWRAQQCSNGRTYAVRDEIRNGHKVTIFVHEEIAQRIVDLEASSVRKPMKATMTKDHHLTYKR